jgi:NAD(P)-dependent dehydrogenase (short-subunit alcohol dehydrogenase family)
VEISGKVALVTGAGSGIGASLSSSLAAAGAKVVLGDVDAGALEKVARAIAAGGADVLALELDVTSREAWHSCAERIRNKFGGAEILCSNAGVSSRRVPIGELVPEEWDRLIDVNLTGVFNGARTFLSEMLRPGYSGHIVNTASVCGLFGTPALGPYTASKFGVVGLSEVMRFELAPRGVGVSVLCPGFVATQIVANSIRAMQSNDDAVLSGPDQEREALGNYLQTAMSPDQVAAQVIEAIRHNWFYVFTHREYSPVIHKRMTAISAALTQTEPNSTPDDPAKLGSAWLEII